jgi:ABC-2 type transport system ATP-binding protein
MLSALIAPTAGSATVAGFRLGEQDTDIRRNVGILTEAPGLYEKLSAEANLLYYARLYEVERPEPQVDKYLDLLQLADRKTEPVSGFSKGMKQKVAIARALVHEPKVLFLDEPTAALDPEAAKTVRDFIKELRTEGRTIFLCTHDLDEAERLCDRIAVFKQSLIALDTPEALRRRLYGRQTMVRLVEITPEVMEAARRIGAVKEVHEEDHELLLTVSDPDKDNPAIVTALVAAGAQIQAVSEVKHSLEDVYLTLVHEGSK